MKTPGEAAMELPWLAPCVASMTVLAKSPLSSVWTQIRTDPGIVLLLARLFETPSPEEIPHTAFLEELLRHQPHFSHGHIDWNQAGPAAVLCVCHRQAYLASLLANRLEADEKQAWIAGFLAPLGWLAVTTATPHQTERYLELLQGENNHAAGQRRAWGHDHTALARRLCRAWRLPAWLSAIIGHLDLPTRIAQQLGAPPNLLAIVQLATALLQERGLGLGLALGASSADLLRTLNLLDDEADELADAAVEARLPLQKWDAPGSFPLLTDLLQLAMENSRQNDTAWIERLQLDLDCLQQALVQQCAEEDNRLHSAKLSALAEFAAGAGHEINNPLAVISGQAQYVLKQLVWLEAPAEEIENVGEYLEGLHAKVAPSLNKIIGQTQRIHLILTELMQFARPSKPRFQSLSVRSLIQEVTNSWQSLADQRQVRVFPLELTHDEILHADLGQARIALSALVRNAI